MTKYRIPVRVVTPPVTTRRARVLDTGLPNEAAIEEATATRTQTGETAVEVSTPTFASAREKPATRALRGAAKQAVQEAAQEASAETQEREPSYRSSEEDEWKERALRLQADMARYRQRQKRIAHEQAQAEQITLLQDVLAVADNLDRALAAARGKPDGRDPSDALTQGVRMTRAALQRTLAKYGLEQFQVQGEPFDPVWHEAVHVVPANVFGVRPGTVVEVLEDGYRREGTLFRPAKVVVAQ